MNKIIITSIFPPTEAIEKFAALKDHQLTVVGDKKTPAGWSYSNTRFLSVQDQETSGFKLASVLPYNHYCRKMIGYLDAMKDGAEVIIDTDDDNIPKENWVFPETSGTFETIAEDAGFINIYEYYTESKIWPRGLPLSLINQKTIQPLAAKEMKVGIWQGLADEDPDVDAIYRLTSDALCLFKEREPIVLDKGTICPFNSQNTLVVKELFPLLYLPTYVTFRFTDILRGLVAQPIMWLYGYKLGFINATVVQKRNPHDYFKDFLSEVPMFQYGHLVPSIVSRAISADKSISENLMAAYLELEKEGIVEKREIETLEAWLQDIANMQK